MAILTANGIGVYRGVVSLPRVGAWHADLEVDTTDALTGAVAMEAGGITFRGTVSRGASYLGVAHVRVVGGADGLRKRAKPVHYVHPQVRTPLGDLLRAAGETLSATVLPAILNRQLEAWTVLDAPIGEQLSVLVARALGDGVAWRVLADGTVWVGVETWPAAGIADDAFRELGRSPVDDSLELGLDGAVLLPGTTLDGRRIDYCEHILEDGELRTRAWVAA